jgi:hypothetical protein
MRAACMKSVIVQKSVANVVKTGSIEQSWINIYSDLRSKQIDVPSLYIIFLF